MIQYVRTGGNPGMYFAYPGTPMDSLAIEGDRELQQFIVTSPIVGIESTAATVPSLAPGVGGLGDGTQLIMPKGWENFITRVK